MAKIKVACFFSGHGVDQELACAAVKAPADAWYAFTHQVAALSCVK